MNLSRNNQRKTFSSKKGFKNKQSDIKNHHKSEEEQALRLFKAGNELEAEEIYRNLIAKKTLNYRVYLNLATLCGRRGATSEMVKLLTKALELNKNYPEAYNNLGVALKSQGKLNEAISSFEKALKLNPNFIQSQFQLGIALKDIGELNRAISSFEKVLELNPNLVEAHSNLGVTLKKKGQLFKAINAFEKALDLDPDSSEILFNLGVTLQAQNDLKAAVSSYQKALKINPTFIKAYCNLGVALHELGFLNQAISAFEEALKLNNQLPDAHFNLANVQLLTGDYKSGLTNYEWRHKIIDGLAPHAQPKLKLWEGESLGKEPLLVVSEQGLGDTLLHMRYVPYLQSQNIEILFASQSKLHSLIKASAIHSNPLSPEQANKITKGKWVPLLSIAKYLGIAPGNPIVSTPYISANDQLITKWEKILINEKRPIIGINWQGNPELEKKTYKDRSIPLEKFALIAEKNQITLLSLQKGYGAQQFEECTFRQKFVKSQAQIDSTWDFNENAAIISNCELVITCDTSIAHLAGGLGKNVWLLLRDVPFWTWGMRKENTFWYPSMKLFRQKERNNWDEVMERVSIELNKVFY